jgi:hypothetical protein
MRSNRGENEQARSKGEKKQRITQRKKRKNQ